MVKVYQIIGMKRTYYPSIVEARKHIYRYGKPHKVYELSLSDAQSGKELGLPSWTLYDPLGFSKGSMYKGDDGIWMWSVFPKKGYESMKTPVNPDGTLRRSRPAALVPVKVNELVKPKNGPGKYSYTPRRKTESRQKKPTKVFLERKSDGLVKPRMGAGKYTYTRRKKN